MQKDQTSQGIPKREEKKGENARRSDIRANNSGKTTKKENSEMRFGRILTDRTSKRQKNRALNKLLSFLYCEASNQLPGLQARWVLARAIFENGWPQNPAHSGLEWNQLCKHFCEMTTIEKVSVINDTILPLLMRKTIPAGVVVEPGISVDQVDQVDNGKAAIEHLKKLVANGEVSEDEALVILQAQKDLMSRRSQE